ncbi:phosphatase [Clavulina sp. PMI_390]|nr:phosphatase [Clavulina sp. PMI_390]
MADHTYHDFKGLLFDMDGTLIDSTLAVQGAWASFAVTYPHLNIEEILKTSHGIRTEENLQNFIPTLTPEQVVAEAERFEYEIVNAAEKNAAVGKAAFVTIPGIAENILPKLAGTETWAVCTSATRIYATKALPLAGIPYPSTFVTADDVTIGKPDPAPYLKGAEGLKLSASDCLVLEDAPAGVRSGKAAGSKVLAVVTTHSRESLEAAGADFILPDFSGVVLEKTEEGWRVGIPKA